MKTIAVVTIVTFVFSPLLISPLVTCAVPVSASKIGANIKPFRVLAIFRQKLIVIRWMRFNGCAITRVRRGDMGCSTRQCIENNDSLKSNLPLLADSLQSVLARS